LRANDTHTPRADLVVRVETCEAIIREFMANPNTAIPRSVLQNARGLMILSQFKAGFIFGVKGGYGVLMVKKPNGRWSLPVLIDASEASLGLQVGAKSVDTVWS
jgi:lipid-binding SYLF domain-containing protein